MLILTSCSTSKNFKVTSTSKEKVIEYYGKNGISIENILFPKDPIAYNKLGEARVATIPEVTIFDLNGKRIMFQVDVKCQAITNKYIQEIENEQQSNYFPNLDLKEYLSYFNVEDINSILIENTSKKILFINSATFTDDLNAENFELKNKVNLNKVKIYYSNFDVLNTWDSLLKN